MNRNILITGSNGQLGRALKKFSKNYHFNFHFFSRKELDISDYERLNYFLEKFEINTVVNCAAYTNVDNAESNKSFCNKINNNAVGFLSDLCEKYNIRLIHISTDYVFDGQKCTPYTESDSINPLNYYGKTKSYGEKKIINSKLKNSIIIRTSLLYFDNGDSSFINKIIDKVNMGENFCVVNDQYSSPTYAKDLAHTILEIIPLISNNSVEIYHYANSGDCSRYDLAVKINELLVGNSNIKATNTNNNMTKRPLYSVLQSTKIIDKFNLKIRSWEDALKEYIIKQNIILNEI